MRRSTAWTRARSGLGGGGGGLPLPAKKLAHGLAGHRPVLDPVVQALRVDAELDRVAQRVVDAELLDEAAVARAAAIGGHDAVERNLLAACAGQSDCYGHFVVTFSRRLANLNGGTPAVKRTTEGAPGIARRGAGLR